MSKQRIDSLPYAAPRPLVQGLVHES